MRAYSEFLGALTQCPRCHTVYQEEKTCPHCQMIERNDFKMKDKDRFVNHYAAKQKKETIELARYW